MSEVGLYSSDIFFLNQTSQNSFELKINRGNREIQNKVSFFFKNTLRTLEFGSKASAMLFY